MILKNAKPMLNNLLALLKGSIAHLFGDLYLLGIDIVQVDGGVLLLPFDIGIEIKKGLIRRETSVNLHEFLPTPIGQTPHTKHPGDPLQHFLPALVHRLRHLVDHYLHFPHPLDHSVPHLHRIRHISVIQVLINFKDALQLLNAFASPQLQSRFVVLVNLLQMLGGLLTATRPVPLKFMTHQCKPSSSFFTPPFTSLWDLFPLPSKILLNNISSISSFNLVACFGKTRVGGYLFYICCYYYYFYYS